MAYGSADGAGGGRRAPLVPGAASAGAAIWRPAPFAPPGYGVPLLVPPVHRAHPGPMNSMTHIPVMRARGPPPPPGAVPAAAVPGAAQPRNTAMDLLATVATVDLALADRRDHGSPITRVKAEKALADAVKDQVPLRTGPVIQRVECAHHGVPGESCEQTLERLGCMLKRVKGRKSDRDRFCRLRPDPRLPVCLNESKPTAPFCCKEHRAGEHRIPEAIAGDAALPPYRYCHGCKKFKWSTEFPLKDGKVQSRCFTSNCEGKREAQRRAGRTDGKRQRRTSPPAAAAVHGGAGGAVKATSRATKSARTDGGAPNKGKRRRRSDDPDDCMAAADASPSTTPALFAN